MAYNKKKGGKSHKKGKKNNNISNQIIFREDGEEYVIVQKMHGGGRCQVLFPDNTTKIAIIPGKLKRRSSWISCNDLILVSIRDFEEAKCDVLFKYLPTHINILKKKICCRTRLLNNSHLMIYMKLMILILIQQYVFKSPIQMKTFQL